ncbi:MAG: DUF2281 domain-containing protein [Bacteroidota bacterium]
MKDIQLYSEISALPASMKQEVKDFVDFLKTKKKSGAKIKEREFRCSKGFFKMHDDFDEPLDDFKNYM